MALTFDGVNDQVTRASVVMGTTLSIFAWINPTGQGNGAAADAGTLLQHGAVVGPTYRVILAFNGTAASKKMRLAARWSTGNGVWDYPAFAALSVWHSIGVTYDFGSTSNVPVFYTDGASVSVTTISSPTGVAAGDTLTAYVGSDETAGDRLWVGRIAELTVWASKILTAADMKYVHERGPYGYKAPYLYWPFFPGTANAKDLSGNGRDGTISGPVVSQSDFGRVYIPTGGHVR